MHPIAPGESGWEWEHPGNGRWYRAQWVDDLWDGQVLELSWGGKRRRGVSRATVAVTPTEVAAAVAVVAARRRQHGYLPCPSRAAD